jgi:hypothetical protein
MAIKIQIKQINAYGDTIRHHTIDNITESNVDDEIDAALIKLLQHSWSLTLGDSIKIVEA